MIRRTFLAILGGCFGGVDLIETPHRPHVTWRVYWRHVKDNEHAVTVYLYGENEPQPSLIFTNKGGTYLAWKMRQICEEGKLTDKEPIKTMPLYVRDLLRTMTYGIDVLLGDVQLTDQPC